MTPALDLVRWISASRGRALLLLLAVLVAPACKDQIGDACELAADCSVSGDRLCDISMPGGYCTIFNCEPDTCPEEAVCIAYRNTLAPIGACMDTGARARLERTFCMRRCKSSDDCRAGYSCVDMDDENPWSATVAEKPGVSGRVCALPYDGPPIDESVSSEVCSSYSSSEASPGGEGSPEDAGTAPDGG